MKFEDLNLHIDIQRAIQDMGFEKPTLIQEQAIPLLLDGGDLIGSAQTGTGKTAAFMLPILDRIWRNENRTKGFQVLILEPTRELAQQVEEQVKLFGKYTTIRCQCVYGGVAMGPQEDAFKSGVEIIAATPGRLIDHMRQGNVDTSKMCVLVLDEADRMLDMGFIPDVRQILSKIPENRQTLFFSATITGEVKRLSDDMLKNPRLVSIEPDRKTAAKVDQHAYPVAEHLKPFLLQRLLEQEHVTSALVFTQTKVGADKVAAIVERTDLKVAKIHGDLTQAVRQQALNAFKSGDVDVLVATDVAARGIDVEGISHVINFNPPQGAEDYVHRIGRTARADKEGHAITLFSPAESMKMTVIEKFIQMKINRRTVEDFDYNEELGLQHEIRQGHDGITNFKRPGRDSRGPKSNGDSAGSSTGSGQASGKSRTGRQGRDGARGSRSAAGRGGRPSPGGHGGHDNDDGSGVSEDGLAEIVIKRAGRPATAGPRGAEEDRPSETISVKAEKTDRPQNPETGDKGRDGNRAGRGRGGRSSAGQGRERVERGQGKSPGADMSASDVLRKAGEQKALVDDQPLSLRPSRTEISDQAEVSRPSQAAGSFFPEEKISIRPSESSPARPSRQPRPSTGPGQNRGPRGKNNTGRSPGQAPVIQERDNINTPANGAPRRRRRRGGRGRGSRNRNGAPGQANPNQDSTQKKSGGLLARIKGFFSSSR